MNKKISSYYEVLRMLTRNIIVTDTSDKELDLQKAFKKIVQLLISCGKAGRKIFFIGNGASASISSHMAVDFSKHAGIRAMAFNDPALLTCMSNDYGYENVFTKPLDIFGDKGDILIVISSSGRSENILRAVKSARLKGIKVITLSGFSAKNPLRKIGNLNFYIPADRYSHVEVMHHSICHYLLELVVENN